MLGQFKVALTVVLCVKVADNEEGIKEVLKRRD
jgi:hypothetical protein